MWSSWRVRSPAIAWASSGSNPAIVIEALNMKDLRLDSQYDLADVIRRFHELMRRRRLGEWKCWVHDRPPLPGGEERRHVGVPGIGAGAFFLDRARTQRRAGDRQPLGQ